MENKYHVADNRISEHADSVEGDNVVNPMGCAPNSSGSVAEECTESGEVMKSQEFAGSLPNEIYVYREDVVRCSKYEGLLGVVMEVAGDSDSEGSTIDDSDSEDKEDESGDGSNEDDNDNSGGTDKDDSLPDDSCEDDSLPDGSEEEDSLPDGHVRVKWIDGSETTENHSNITVVDRMLLHGNIVASASDPTGQMGLVVDVNITVDLLAANGEVIQDISSRNLKQVRDFSVGDCVIFKSWIGRVDDIIDNVTVLFDDGSACKVVKADPLRLKSVSKTAIDDESCPYYPGQRVRAISSSVFRSSKWLSGVWKANRLEGTVIKVEAESVVVDWIATAYLGAATNSSATAPSEEQNPKNLALLSWYLHANWQLGDWCLLPSHPLLSSSSADEPSTTSNLKEPSEGCMSLIGDSKDRLNGNFQSQSSDSVDLERMTYLDGSSRHELHNASPEYGSCSTSLSLSEEPVHESCPLHSKKLHKVLHKKDKKARRRVETFEKALYIVSSRTKVNVVWQDGTREFGLDATSLLSIRNPCDHDFFPQQYVVDKASNEGDDYSEIKRMGVVRSVNAKERTACVRWLKPVSRPEDAWEFDNEEVVSAYELDLHPDYDYCYGDLVVRLPPVSVSADVASFGSPIEELEQQADPAEVEGDASRKHSEYSKADQTSKKFSCLSWVGNITGLQDGEIEVTWADGAVSEVGPQAVYVVDLEDEESSDCESEVSDTGASWATVDENETDELENTGKEADFQIPDDDIVGRKRCTASPEVNSRQNRPLSVLLAAPGFFITLARKLFYRVREHLDLLRSYDRVINVAGSEKNIKNTEKETINNELTSQESNALGFLTAQTAHGISEECRHIAVTEDAEVTMNDTLDNLVSIDINADTKGAYSNDDPCSFKHFDSSENPLDHHFLGWSGENTGGRKWVKKVQQEWSILEKNLPDAIYVRVFEDRMDLLRAAIVGACGTPYEDGLFFFDFYLTPEFPRVPPSAYYHSGGLRINPNLYVDGKVCLSLLNTWDGKGNEVWDSSSSSILQVLVSLQGLVLNSKPYFNEAGYDKQVGTVEGEKNSLSYNENAYLLNLRSMLYVLRRPPMHFEAFVKDHFRRRGHFILKACDAYMKNCLIGSLTKDSCMDDKNREHLCSVGFKLILAKIMPRLISTFSGVGVECHQFKHLQKC